MEEGTSQIKEERAPASASNEAQSPEPKLANRVITAIQAGAPIEAVSQALKAEPQQVAERAIVLLPDMGKESALPLLFELAKTQPDNLAATAVEAMGRIPGAEAVRMLSQLGETGTSRTVRKAAKRSLHRLRSMGMTTEPEATPAPERPTKTTSITSAMVTSIDGAGNRLIWLLADRPFGGVQLISLLVDDMTGIRDISEGDISRQDFEEELARKREESPFAFVDVPVDYAIQLVEEARARNRETNTPIPRDFHAWRRIIGAPGRHYDKPLIYENLRAAEILWNPSYLAESAALLAEPETVPWFLPFEEVEDYVEEIRAVHESRVFLPNVTKEDRENAVINRAIPELFGGTKRDVMRRRLEETAYIFFTTGRERSARLALAAALEMENSDVAALVRNPFLRALTQMSIELYLRPPGTPGVTPGLIQPPPNIVIPR